MFIRVVAQGGNLLLIVAPDGDGVIPANQKSRLKAMGEWLETNGEAIYETRQTVHGYDETIFGKNVFYTQSTDGRYTYAISLKRPKKEILLSKVRARQGTQIKLLGFDQPLSWTNFPWGLTIRIPKAIEEDPDFKNELAWAFKFEGMHATGQDPAIQAE